MSDNNNFKEVTVTTVDNPFNPFKDFRNWFDFDIEKGYYTSSKLARLTNISDDMSELEKNEEIERGIDKLIKIDPFDIYTKIYKE